MKEIKVQSRQGDYKIYTGKNILSRTGVIAKRSGVPLRQCLVVTQKKIESLYGTPVRKSLEKQGGSVMIHIVPDGETAKTEKVLFQIYRTLVKHAFERKDLMVALGGGVVGDLAGFAAASYMRGIPFLNIGTTLLAQVDSAIGGKTGINLPEGKNLVGAFYAPQAVILDAGVLKTLPERELSAASAEIVKYGIIRDARLFRILEASAERFFCKDENLLEKLVFRSASIKAGIVTRDEFETKQERMHLNFGHTFGHGIEQVSGYTKLLHGEAVGLGMVCALRLAVKLKLFPVKDEFRVVQLIKHLHLPVSLKELRSTAADIFQAMSRDKKRAAGKMRFVLPTAIGRVVVRDDISPAMVQSVLKEAGAR